jgi:hypothetical protein
MTNIKVSPTTKKGLAGFELLIAFGHSWRSFIAVSFKLGGRSKR